MSGTTLRQARLRPRWLLLSAGLALLVVGVAVVAGPPSGTAATSSFRLGIPNDQLQGIRPPSVDGTPPGGSGFANRNPSIDLDVVAAALGIGVDQLRSELAAGNSLANVIVAHGSTTGAVADALVAAAKLQLDQQVAAGSLTLDQESQQLATLRRQFLAELAR